ncbi:MAG TPA: SLAP domain-containing protein [Candidatus Companilactobacillus pullicola]|uniref:SLAP domain-containing protein n=1 Tax=Candidatus Companilactobacillus pullicola TaxID=2838523 RepID=A0A9D1ZPQ0_9LACO|nr:SLAP domain-containing protein [Candidatus Companilactobacillus pullicola]
MLLNKKCVYLGATLFSAMILTSLSNQTVKADVTTDGNTNVSVEKTVQPTTAVTTKTSDSTTQAPTNKAGVSKTVTATQSSTVDTKTETAPATDAQKVTAPVDDSVAKATVTQATKSVVKATPTVVKKIQPITVVVNKPNSAATVIDFKDPTLSSMVKWSLGLTDKDKVTVGEFQKFNNSEFFLNETVYAGGSNPNVTDQTDKPIENLSGLQVLKYLPKNTQVFFQVRLASDPKANLDLSPLYGIPIYNFTLDGNYSDAKAKEIDLNQLTKLDISKATNVELTGDTSVSANSGITQQQLEKIAPWLVKFANNGRTYNDIVLNNGSISDFSALKGINRTNSVTVFVNHNNVASTKPVYATASKADLTFTALPFKGIDGDDLASTYHYTTTVKKPSDDDLIHVSGDTYRIADPDTSAKKLTYGIIGDYISSNDDSMLEKSYGNSTLDYFGMYSQPLVWKTVAKPVVKPAVKPATKPVTGPTIEPVQSSIISSGSSSGSVGSVDVPETSGSTANSSNAISVSTSRGTVRTINSYTRLFDAKGNVTAIELGPNTGWSYNGIVDINGKKFYEVGTNEYLPADSGVTYTPIKIRTVISAPSSVVLFNSNGDRVSRTLPARSHWLTDSSAIINGVKMYRVASDEWVAADSVSISISSGDKTYATSTTFPKVFTGRTKTPVYSANGKLLNYQLSSGSSWKIDRRVIIDGVTYYRIATDEFVRA